MAKIVPLHTGMLTVLDYRCTAGPNDKPFWEKHCLHSISYVRKGNFGYHAHGRSFELVAGSVLVGSPNKEYQCTHEHHVCGDECLSFQLLPELIDIVAPKFRHWDIGSVPPVMELVGFGELAQAAAENRCDLSVEEVAYMFITRFIEVVAGNKRNLAKLRLRDRKRAVDSALRIDESANQPLNLETLAKEVGLSPFHFLRIFKDSIGVTPHQYLVRSRIRRASRLLATESCPVTDVGLDVGFLDISNFIRTFHRATGVSPAKFRQASRGNRKIFQESFPAIV